jgi:thiamine-phosphate pyrophosphorylase
LNNRFKIILLTPEHFVKNEIDHVCRFFKSGLEILHMRKPSASKKDLRDYLKQIPEKFHKFIVLHNHYELVKEFHLKGAHLTSKSRISKNQIDFLIRNKIKIISSSFHSVKAINLNRRKYEYMFLSPVFDSISKTNYKSNFDLENLKPLLRKKKNIIALGGINDKNIASVKQIGFSGAAALGFVWESKKPMKNYKKLMLKIK